jgi:hypothetical protein
MAEMDAKTAERRRETAPPRLPDQTSLPQPFVMTSFSELP